MKKMSNKIRIVKYLAIVFISLQVAGCKIPGYINKTENISTPASYIDSKDTTTVADLRWNEYFTDPNLVALIDSALVNNKELNISLLEINVSNNEIMAKTGEYLPFLNVGGIAGVDKVGRYTSTGSSEATTDIEPGKATPDPLSEFKIGAYVSWEIDIWKKLRNGKKAAVRRYLASVEGKNFLQTQLIAEVANSYYELLALDNQLAIVKQNIELQNDALEIVKLQKESARVTELAVRRFEAQVLYTKSLQFDIQQMIVETENKINFLLGRYPQPIVRTPTTFLDLESDTLYAGIPSQLLENRPDVRQAEQELLAAKLDVKVAKANFYPSLNISAAIGLEAFNPSYILKAPESMLYSLAGDLVAPLINRKAIKATYYSANAKQLQAIYNYEQTILNAYLEVSNQLSKIDNLKKSYELKSQQVDALTESIEISNDLFSSARADYMEVLLTQRDALESKFELIETKKRQLLTNVEVYRALGGGWK